jgi:hypothetical protein
LKGEVEKTGVSVSTGPSDFVERTNAVNSACCDPGNEEMCASGVPQACDARCALTFLEYYTQCHSMLDATMAPLQMTGLHRLDDVCMQLPPAELLLALGQASCGR